MQQEQHDRTGWDTFAAVIMFAIGFTRLISSIQIFRGVRSLTNVAGTSLANNADALAFWDLVIAVLAIWAGYSLLSNGRFGRVLTYVLGVLVIMHGFVIISVDPWYGIAAIALASFVIWGVAKNATTAQSATGSGTPSETTQAMSSQLAALQQQATTSAESAGCSSS